MAKMYDNILEWAKDNEVELSSKDRNLIVKSGGITSLKNAFYLRIPITFFKERCALPKDSRHFLLKKSSYLRILTAF